MCGLGGTSLSFYAKKMLSSSSLSPDIFRLLCRKISLSRTRLASHYDTLKLKRDCTQKEIREAFLNLSKQLHPDKNKSNPNNHAQFVKLNEAYSILSKPNRRSDYDLFLWDSSNGKTNWNKTGSFKDETLWEHRDASQDRFYEDRSYYGIAGIKKLPNSWIVVFCFFFTLVGVGLQALAINSSVTFERDKLDEYSMKNSLMHSAVRQQAKDNGNEVQLELLRKRLADAAATNQSQQDVREHAKEQSSAPAASI